MWGERTAVRTRGRGRIIGRGNGITIRGRVIKSSVGKCGREQCSRDVFFVASRHTNLRILAEAANKDELGYVGGSQRGG